jgi:hypothetical protein
MSETKQLVCAYCGEEFEPTDDETWDDVKAHAELEQNFPGVPIEECAVVCDDCFKVMMRQ